MHEKKALSARTRRHSALKICPLLLFGSTSPRARLTASVSLVLTAPRSRWLAVAAGLKRRQDGRSRDQPVCGASARSVQPATDKIS